MNQPKTHKEALIAEMLGDIDGLLLRVEQYPAIVQAMQVQILEAAQRLDNSGIAYRKAVQDFTIEAKDSLNAFAQAKVADINAQVKLSASVPNSKTDNRIIKTALAAALASSTLTAAVVLTALKMT